MEYDALHGTRVPSPSPSGQSCVPLRLSDAAGMFGAEEIFDGRVDLHGTRVPSPSGSGQSCVPLRLFGAEDIFDGIEVSGATGLLGTALEWWDEIESGAALTAFS